MFVLCETWKTRLEFQFLLASLTLFSHAECYVHSCQIKHEMIPYFSDGNYHGDVVNLILSAQKLSNFELELDSTRTQEPRTLTQTLKLRQEVF